MKVLKQVILFTALLLISFGASAAMIEGKAPDFTLKSLKGENVKLSEHQGEVVMINLF